MKLIRIIPFLSIIIFYTSCQKSQTVIEPKMKKCVVTRMIDSSSLGIDTTWYSYDVQNRLIREDYSNPYYSMNYTYQVNQVIQRQIVNSTGAVQNEFVFNLNDKGLATSAYFTNSSDTLYLNYDSQDRIVKESRKRYNFLFEYTFDNNGDNTKIIYKSYDGSKTINTTFPEYYNNIPLNPNVNADGRIIRFPWLGKFTAHAYKKLDINTFNYALDDNGNIKKTTMLNQNNIMKAIYFEYKCD